MAIQKSRLGRGLGNLIAGGISGAKPPAPASKPAPVAKPAPAAKPAPVAAKKAAPAAKSKPASKPTPKPAKPVAKAPAKAQPAAKPKATPAKPAPKQVAAPTQKPAQAGSTKADASAKPASAKPVTPSSPAQTPPAVSQQPAVAAPARQTAVTPQTSGGHSVQADTATPQQTTVAKPASPAATPAVTTTATPAPAAVGATPVASHSSSATAHTGNAATHAGSTTAHTGNAAASPAAPASPYREISVSAVVPNPYQPRRDMDAEHIAELANSIASEGLLQPIVVRPLEGGKSYELIAGERRWRAHQKLGLRTIAARVMDASDTSSAVISLIENIQRQALNPIEEALGFASLMRDFDLTQEAVSERIGRARASIANALRLLALDREIQGYVSKGILSVGHAKILLGVEEPAQRLLIARRIIEGGISVRETEALVKRLKNDRHARPAPGSVGNPSEADRTAIADLEKQLSSRLNTKVQLRHTPKKGRIVIEYYGNEDLQRILERTGLQL